MKPTDKDLEKAQLNLDALDTHFGMEGKIAPTPKAGMFSLTLGGKVIIEKDRPAHIGLFLAGMLHARGHVPAAERTKAVKPAPVAAAPAKPAPAKKVPPKKAAKPAPAPAKVVRRPAPAKKGMVPAPASAL